MNERSWIIQQGLAHCLTETHFDWGPKYRGKVRDTYDLGDTLAIVTTDRQSAFDRILAAIPFKGQVLNQCSAWWFARTRHIIANHCIATPDPNVTLAKKCRVFPIELVVRAYASGSTKTALWTQYQQGVRHYCGQLLPEGLRKNEALPQPILTPTTKEASHDRPISPQDIIKEGWMSDAHWQEASHLALRLFRYGSEIARERGLILVDTKYEMGLDEQGKITLIDEIHTPDSSRFWLADSYQQRLQQGEEPEQLDKEFLRLWFVQHCDPYTSDTLPTAPDNLLITLAQRYIHLFETLSGEVFDPCLQPESIEQRIEKNMIGYLTTAI